MLAFLAGLLAYWLDTTAPPPSAGVLPPQPRPEARPATLSQLRRAKVWIATLPDRR